MKLTDNQRKNFLDVTHDDAQKYITIEAKHIRMQSEDAGLYVPSGVLRGRFSQNTLDNLDFYEHTPTGVTMHATTHNIYQYKDDDVLVNIHSYMVTILKEYIHAERVWDWNEHLASVEKMLHSVCTTHKVHDISSHVFKRHAGYGKDTPRRIFKVH